MSWAVGCGENIIEVLEKLHVGDWSCLLSKYVADFECLDIISDSANFYLERNKRCHIHIAPFIHRILYLPIYSSSIYKV